jgi:regulator of vacuolar morphogenesis
VGELRDLGKRAAKILLKMQETEFKRSTEDSDASDSDPGDAEEPQQGEINQAEDQGEDSPAGASVDQQHTDMADVDLSAALEAAKLRLQAKLQSEADLDATDEQSRAETRDSVQQARVLLDMIITIVGEFFGQRDLLDAREVWTRDEALAEL